MHVTAYLRSARRLLENPETITTILPHESICCWYSFEFPRQIEAIQMCTNKICSYKAINKSTRSVIGRLRNCLIVRL